MRDLLVRLTQAAAVPAASGLVLAHPKTAGFREDDPVQINITAGALRQLALVYQEASTWMVNSPAPYEVVFEDQAADKAEALNEQQQGLLQEYLDTKAMLCALEENLLLAGVEVDQQWTFGADRELEIMNLEVDGE